MNLQISYVLDRVPCEFNDGKFVSLENPRVSWLYDPLWYLYGEEYSKIIVSILRTEIKKANKSNGRI